MARAKKQKRRGFVRKGESKVSKKQAEQIISIAALFCVSGALVREAK